MELLIRFSRKAEDEAGSAPTPSRDGRADEALALLRSEWAALKEPGLSSEALAARTAWVGGAIRMFSLFTGQDAESVQRQLGAVPVAGSKYEQAGVQFRPVRPDRPQRHPGAQRPVDPESSVGDDEHAAPDRTGQSEDWSDILQ